MRVFGLCAYSCMPGVSFLRMVQLRMPFLTGVLRVLQERQHATTANSSEIEVMVFFPFFFSK